MVIAETSDSQLLVLGSHAPKAASSSASSLSSCFDRFWRFDGGAGESSVVEPAPSRRDFLEAFFFRSFALPGGCGAPPILWWYLASISD